MDEEINIPAELGFSEFVAKLISETFEAVLASQLKQNEQTAEINSLATISVEEFSDRYFQDSQHEEQVDILLAGLFPHVDKMHSVFKGSKYTPATESKPEQPNYLQALGVELEAADYVKTNKTLKASGVEKIYAVARLKVAQEAQQAFINLMKLGVPTVLVDSGKINAKLSFNISEVRTEETESDTPSNASSSISSLHGGLAARPRVDGLASSSLAGNVKLMKAVTFAPLPSYKRNIYESALSNKFKLSVKQVSKQDAIETSSSTANVFSEIEIKFRTIN